MCPRCSACGPTADATAVIASQNQSTVSSGAGQFDWLRRLGRVSRGHFFRHAVGVAGVVDSWDLGVGDLRVAKDNGLVRRDLVEDCIEPGYARWSKVVENAAT